MYKGNKKDIGAIALYINSELKKGRTQKEIEIIDFNVNERVIEKRLKRNGYKKINNEYIIPGISESKKSDDKSDDKCDDKSDDKCDDKSDDKCDDKCDDKSMTTFIRSKKLEENLIDLLNNYDKLKNIINEYDREQGQEQKKTIIEIPLENEEDFRTTIRVNKSIWNEFNEFSLRNEKLNKKDLLSMALKEYIENHK